MNRSKKNEGSIDYYREVGSNGISPARGFNLLPPTCGLKSIQMDLNNKNLN